MANPVKMKDQYKDKQLLDYVRQVVDQLMTQVSKFDTDPIKQDKELQKIKNIMVQFGYTVNQIIPVSLIEDYFGGVEEANKILEAAGMVDKQPAPLTDEGKISKPFQKVIHMEALENLIDDTMLDLQAAVAMAQVSADTTVKKVLQEVKGQIVQGLVLGDPRHVMKHKLMNAFRKEGMTSFVTTDQKKLPLDFYAMTVARTKSRTATVQGSANRYMDAGQDLVEVVGNGDSCKECSIHRGMVYSLTGKTRNYPQAGTGAYRLPPFHPNCRCGIRLWDYNNKTAKERKDAVQRRKEFDPNKDRRTPQQVAQYKQEQSLRRKANAEKKQFMRWQDMLGAEAPASLAAFRRMKRQNTVQFQLLQSEYRSRSLATAVRRAPNQKPRVIATDIRRLDGMLQSGYKMEDELMQHFRTNLRDMDITDVRQMTEFREQWMGHSARHESAVVQDWLARKHGYPYKPLSTDEWNRKFPITSGIERALDEQRKFYQDKFRNEGFTHVKVYRGFGFDDYGDESKPIPGWFPQLYDKDGYTTLNDNEFGRALASFSYDPKAARGFARGFGNNVVMEVDIPVDQIYSAFGLGKEREIVPLGKVSKMKPAAMSKSLRKKLGNPEWAKSIPDTADVDYENISLP